VLLVLAAVALLQVWRLTTGGRADLSGRTRAATALATLVLVLGAAAVAWWQLRRTGSPLVTREDGSLGTDLVAGAAPALLLATARRRCCGAPPPPPPGARRSGPVSAGRPAPPDQASCAARPHCPRPRRPRPPRSGWTKTPGSATSRCR